MPSRGEAALPDSLCLKRAFRQNYRGKRRIGLPRARPCRIIEKITRGIFRGGAMPDRQLAAFLALGLLTGLAGYAPAQRTKLDAAGSFKSYEFLLVNASVQKGLKLSDEQVLKVNSAVHDIRHKRRAELEKLRNLPAPKGREKFLQILEANSQEALNSSDKILTAEQVKRLKQIRVQQDGFDAFYDDAVVAALKLSKEQQQQIK